MATPFETFVNVELPKRPSTNQDPLILPAGMLPISTGVGLELEFVDPLSIVQDGEDGADGTDGQNGKTAYELALTDGFEGTLPEWLLSIKGDKGDQGSTGEAGFLNLMGTLGEIAELPNPLEQPEGAAYLINKELWVVYEDAWVNSGDISGPEGSAGVGLRIRGHLNSTADLPQSGMEVGDTWIISPKMWVWDSVSWQFVGERGPTGASIYELAVEDGFVGSKKDYVKYVKAKNNYELAYESGFSGTLHQWLTQLKGAQGETGSTGSRGLKGEQGDKGDQGEPALPIVLKGTVATEQDLPLTANESDAYVIVHNLFVWLNGEWIDVGPIIGPKGDRGIKGEEGDMGPQGGQGPVGLNNYELAQFSGFTGTLEDWLNTMAGRDGLSAYEQDVAAGFSGSVSDWLWSLHGPAGLNGVRGATGATGNDGFSFNPKGSVPTVYSLESIPLPARITGDTYFTQDVGDVFSWNGSDWVLMGNSKGPAGPRGPVGPGLRVMGVFDTPSQLPESGAILGDGYIIGTDFWIWNNTEFVNAGTIVGPKGDEGEKGDTGIQGPKGARGDRGIDGNYWIVLPRPPGPVDGQPNDYYVNSSTLEMFHKTDNIRWAFLGYIGGGNVYDAPGDSEEYVRVNGGWAKAAFQDAPNDGASYVRKDKNWIALSLDEAPTDNKQYVRKNGQWFVLAETVSEAPTDGKLYVRVNNGWQVITVDVTEAPLGGEEYVRKSGAWSLPMRQTLKVGSSVGVLDLSVQQAFVVDGTASRTITITNPPGAGRCMVVAVKLMGAGGAITWPANIVWAAGSTPMLGLTFTLVTLFWDGVQWTGSAGSSY